MLYTKRQVRCAATGLTEQEARDSLTQSSKYEGCDILDMTKRGGKWVATILEPKIAEFPPKDDEEDSGPPAPPKEESPEGDGPPSPDSDSEGPDDGAGPEGDGPPKEKSEKGGEKVELHELISLVHQIADHLGISGDPAIPGAGDGPIPPGPPGMAPPPPPPHGGPPGAGGPPPGLGGPPGGPQEILHRKAPPPGVAAFSSTDLSRVGSFDAFGSGDKTIKQAKTELTERYEPEGFKVRQIKRLDDGRIVAKLSRR